jgi:hypothetical protein
MQLPLYMFFLVASIIAGLSGYFQKEVPRYLKLFPLFLVLTLSVECYGFWLAYYKKNNIVLYNVYAILNFSFYLFVLKEVITTPRIKKIIFYAILGFIFFALYNIIFFQHLHNWNSVNYMFGCLLVVAFCIYFFYELFRKPKSTKLSKEPAFWICSGLLFFYCSSFPFLGLNNFLQNIPSILMRNLGYILTVLNILLYTLFTIAFLCRLKIGKIKNKRA